MHFVKIIILLFGLFVQTISLQALNEDKVSSDTIPIEYYNNHLYLKGVVQDVAGNYLFDTGAHYLYFDSLFYNNSTITYKQLANAVQPGVGEKPQKVKVIVEPVDFYFGQHHYKANIVPIISLKTILGDFADGILGINHFFGKLLEINYRKQYIKIYDNIAPKELQEYFQMPLKLVKDKLQLPLNISVDNETVISGNFALDLGSGGTITLNSQVAKEYKLKEKIENKIRYYTKYGGIGGETESYDFIAKKLEFGPFSFEDFQADFSTDNSGALANTEYMGLLGNEILERFDLIIDLKNNILYLKPNDLFGNEFKFSEIGFSYVDRSKTLGAWVVSGFFAGSNAEKSELKIDDRIIEINGTAIKEIDFYSHSNYLYKNDTLLLKVERDSNQFNIKIEKENPFLLKNKTVQPKIYSGTNTLFYKKIDITQNLTGDNFNKL